MKIITSLLVLAFCLVFVGCRANNGPVEEVKAFINEKEDVIVQMSKKIEANPSEAGVDEARTIFEARKDSLKAKREALRQKKLAGDSGTMLIKSYVEDDEMFNMISNNASNKGKWTSLAVGKLAALRKDFKKAVSGE